MKTKKIRLCKECGINPATKPHPCPYRSEIHSDEETLCTCCPACEHECAMDV